MRRAPVRTLPFDESADEDEDDSAAPERSTAHLGKGKTKGGASFFSTTKVASDELRPCISSRERGTKEPLAKALDERTRLQSKVDARSGRSGLPSSHRRS